LPCFTVVKLPGTVSKKHTCWLSLKGGHFKRPLHFHQFPHRPAVYLGEEKGREPIGIGRAALWVSVSSL
jgi:hypothetical protein